MKSASPLPMRDGVGSSCMALPSVNGACGNQWQTITQFLTSAFTAINESEWTRRMECGEVLDEFGVKVTPARAFEAGLKIYYYRTVANETIIPFHETILFQDEHIIAVDKPHFVPVTPAGRYLHESLLVRLKRKLKIETLVPIHRIDRGTAGVVVFCIHEWERGNYQRLFATRDVKKIYEAVAPFSSTLHFPLTHESCMVPDESFMRMKEISGPVNSQTHFQLIRALDGPSNLAHYQLAPITGRKHQLRVHCAALGIPIVNDPMYPNFLPEPAPHEADDFSKPLQLLARSIEFIDPHTGANRVFTSAHQLLLSA